MSDILLIASADTNNQELLRALNELKYNLVKEKDIVSANTLLKQYKFSLVVLIDNILDHPDITSALNLPPQLPILFVDTGDKHPDFATLFSGNRFIDVLSPPFLRERIEHKITLLVTVGEQAKELLSSQNEVNILRQKIDELYRSVDGHNSFLELMSSRDGLTGLYNRRHFNKEIQEHFSRASSQNSDLALLILDIDYFSEINKSCGQDFGDFVLNELSARLTSNSGKKDICFRLSGEEFAILMPSTPEETALRKAEQLRISSEQKSYDNGNYIRTITISVGVAALRTHCPYSHEELINMADQALFLAKSEGRNRCMSHSMTDRSSFGTSKQNFKLLQDTVQKILEKTKVSTMRSLQLLAQAILEGKENNQIDKAQEYAELLSKKMGFPHTLIETFKNAIILLSSIRYLMHSDMISKDGPLSADEWQTISDFPYKIAQITEYFDYFSDERAVLLHHGENYDGSGYPEGLKGEEIPVGARIFSLANAVAAMNTDRPYRKKLTQEEIIEELVNKSGKQFDPELVLKLIDIIREKGILEIDKKGLGDIRKKISRTLVE